LTVRHKVFIIENKFFHEEAWGMAGASKNSRTAVATQKFSCPCGGEVVLKTMVENGKIKNIAECAKCHRIERRPKDFK
jgi:hypothetical protein